MSFITVMLIMGLLCIVAGCWCMIRTYHILKITIGIEVAVKAVVMFIVLAGRVNGNMAIAQSFVITIIVIEVVVAIVGTGMSIALFKKYDSMDVRNLRRLKG